jgi:hypothetical protein
VQVWAAPDLRLVPSNSFSVAEFFGVDAQSHTVEHRRLRRVLAVLFGSVLGALPCWAFYFLGLITRSLAVRCAVIASPMFAITFASRVDLFGYLLPPVLLCANGGLLAASFCCTVLGLLCPVKSWSKLCHEQSRVLYEFTSMLFAQPMMLYYVFIYSHCALLVALASFAANCVSPQMYSTYTVFVWRYCTFVTARVTTHRWALHRELRSDRSGGHTTDRAGYQRGILGRAVCLRSRCLRAAG